MHIAICDDNMADRHHLERLLKRESEKRFSTTGILYTDAFGNCDSLLTNPRQYDVFYIDVCKTDNITGIDVVTKLRELDINVPIILCCSDINYREYTLSGNTYFLDKPIVPDELSDSLNYALHIKQQSQQLIELRDDNGTTIYVTEPDILYAVEESKLVIVTLTDGRKINIFTDIFNLFSQLETYPSFLAPSTKSIINGRYITKIQQSKAIMTDNTIFKIHRSCLEYAKTIFQQYS